MLTRQELHKICKFAKTDKVCSAWIKCIQNNIKQKNGNLNMDDIQYMEDVVGINGGNNILSKYYSNDRYGKDDAATLLNNLRLSFKLPPTK